MSAGNGQPGANGTARWSGRVLSAEDVRGLNGQSEVVLSPRTVVTPMAIDQLKANGIRIVRQSEVTLPQDAGSSAWGIAQERPDALVTSAIRSLERDGLQFRSLGIPVDGSSRWARALAECVARGDCGGGVGFAQDAGLICCIANKVSGLRAVAVCGLPQAKRALAVLAANLIVVEMPGRTLFEIKQILKCACTGGTCPPETLAILRELEDAHR